MNLGKTLRVHFITFSSENPIMSARCIFVGSGIPDNREDMMVGSRNVENMRRFCSATVKKVPDHRAPSAQNDLMPADERAILADQGDIREVFVVVEILESRSSELGKMLIVKGKLLLLFIHVLSSLAEMHSD